VLVELYFGNLERNGDIQNGAALPMSTNGRGNSGSHLFEGQMLCLQTGRFGFTVRVIPHHRLMARKFDPDFTITWAEL
jgi:starch phosphorylase